MILKITKMEEKENKENNDIEIKFHHYMDDLNVILHNTLEVLHFLETKQSYEFPRVRQSSEIILNKIMQTYEDYLVGDEE
jgi:hypothetical protein